MKIRLLLLPPEALNASTMICQLIIDLFPLVSLLPAAASQIYLLLLLLPLDMSDNQYEMCNETLETVFPFPAGNIFSGKEKNVLERNFEISH